MMAHFPKEASKKKEEEEGIEYRTKNRPDKLAGGRAIEMRWARMEELRCCSGSKSMSVLIMTGHKSGPTDGAHPSFNSPSRQRPICSNHTHPSSVPSAPSL